MSSSEHQSGSRLNDHHFAARGASRAWKITLGLLAGAAMAGAAAACSTSSSGATSPTRTPAPGSSALAAASSLGAHSLPGQTSQTLPAFPAFYDAHKDLVVVTDAFPRAAAGIFHANFAPSLAAVQPTSQPAWYVVRGAAAPGQLTVLGSEPGESDYSPLWRTIIVRWKSGVAPKVLTSDNMILTLAKKGELTAAKTSMVVNASVTSKP